LKNNPATAFKSLEQKEEEEDWIEETPQPPTVAVELLGFLFEKGFCDICSQSGDHPQNNLAKSGYILTRLRKLKKTKNKIMATYLLTGT
jgi:2-iminoacetate synthase ThiH